MKLAVLPITLGFCATLSAMYRPGRSVAPAAGAGAAPAGHTPVKRERDGLAPVRLNGFFSPGAAVEPAPRGTTQPASSAQAPARPLPAGSVIRPVVQPREQSPARATAASRRPAAIPSNREETKADASGPGHRRRQAWGPGAGAAAAAALQPATAAAGWKATLAAAGDEAQRAVPGGARLKEAFSVENPAGGQALDLYLAPRGMDEMVDQVVHIHSSLGDPKWSALSLATVMNYPIAPGETVSMFIEQPNAILNFRLLNEKGGLLETIDLVRTEDPEKPLKGVIGAGL